MLRRIAFFILCLSWLPAAQANDVPLRASVAKVIVGAPQSVPPASEFKPFDPNSLLPLQRSNGGLWVRLQPAGEHWPTQGPLVLSLLAYQGSATLRLPAQPPATTSPNDMRSTVLHGHGRLAFALPTAMDPHATVELQLVPYRLQTKPVTFVVQPLSDFASSDARWLAWVSACLAIIALMALLALYFAVVLHDPAFVYYAVFMLALLLLQMLQSGYLFHPLGLAISTSVRASLTLISLGLSVAFATVFLTRFTDTRQWAPRLRIAALIGGWTVCAILLLAALPSDTVYAALRAIILLAVAAQSALMLGLTIFLLFHGSRYAGIFLIAWIPLLALAIMVGLRLQVVMQGWAWLSNAGIAAGAFEAIVLSLGLADRLRAVRRERDKARADADTDPLTGAVNRRLWMRRAETLVETARTQGQPLSVLFIDIDHFKHLNDQHGHHVGDQALGVVVKFLRDQLRVGDLLGRYGGDEFIVALPGCDAERAKHMGERLRRGIERLHRLSVVGGTALTISVGCAELRANDDAIASLLERADKAMYSAKTNGRNRVVYAASIVSVTHSHSSIA